MVVFAQEEARTLKHNYIGTEHILLGLLRVEDGVAAQALESLDITAKRVRAQVLLIVGPGEEAASGQIPFTPLAKKSLELALREAVGLGHRSIGPEHILLGLASENEGIASQILLDFHADSEKVRRVVSGLMADAPQAPKESLGSPNPGGVARHASIHVGLAREVLELLMTAAARSLDDHRTEIELEDLLLALTRDESTAPLLAGLGVDESAIRGAIRSRHAEPEGREGGSPPSR